MKNLKKVLALVMAFACAFTMFAGAAINDFSDSADIKNQDAVSMLTALNVIEGYSDGTFLPNGNVTRAQMAKMIYTIRNGGSTDASIYEDVSTSFSDVNGTWGAGFIKYCQTNGIIAGKSDSIFDPNGNVTIAETAKMALVVLGYRADKASLTGTNWQKNTIALADENDLLEGVTTSVTSPATRDDAAQILYNLIDADAVVWSNDKEEFIKDTVTVGKDGSTSTSNRTAGEKYLGLKKVVGILANVDKTDGTSTYELSISSVDADESSSDYITDFTKVATDYSSYKYQQVKVLYKAKNEVYGVYPTNKNTALAGVLGNFEIDSSKLKFNSTKYTLDTGVVKADGTTVRSTVDDSASSAVSISTFVDNYATKDYYGFNSGYIAKAYDAIAVSATDTSKINEMNVESFAVAQVTNVSSSYINVSVKVNKTGETITTKLTDSDATWYSDIAKDDYVAIIPSSNTTDGNLGVEKLDLVTGKITTLKNSGSHDLQATIGSTVYEMAMDKASSNNSYYGNLEISLKDTVAVVVKDGFIVYIDDNKAVADDIALVIEVGSSTGLGSKYLADVMFPDGTRQEVEIKTLSYGGTANYSNSITDPFLASYTKVSGKYELTQVNASDTAGYDQYDEVTDGTNYVDSSKMVYGNIKYISESATVFTKYYSGDEYKFAVKTGANMRDWSKNASFSSYALSNASNGIQYANVVFADLGKSSLPGGANVTYGYIIENSAVTADGQNYMDYLVWNGTQEITIRTEDTIVYDEGTVVEYSINSDGYADFDRILTKNSDWTLGAVTGWDNGIANMDGAIVIKYEGGSETIDIDYDDDDSYVLFIDTDEGDGSGATTPSTAQEVTVNGETKYVANAAYYNVPGTKTYIVVVDTANEIRGDFFGGSYPTYISK